jgi:hypothetical protein
MEGRSTASSEARWERPGQDPRHFDDGAAVSSTNSPNPGKLVDIDPDQQALSQVIGVQLQVKTPSGAGFTGTLVPCNLQDM